MISDSCGATSSWCARCDGLALTSLCTTSGSGLADATLWVKLFLRRFASAGSRFFIRAVILALAFLRVRLPHQQTNLCSPTLLRTQTPSSSGCRCVCRALRFWSPQSIQPQLQGSASECIRLVLQDGDQLPHLRLADSTGSRAPPNSRSRFQRSSWYLLRIPWHATTSVVLLTMSSQVRVLKPNQQPSNQFTASFCSDPAVLCGLEGICSPNAAICWLNTLPRMRWWAIMPSLPTWNVVNVHAARLKSHFKTELSRLIIAPICRSVKSLIARICPWMVWIARSMHPLALLSPTGPSSYTISVGMWVPALCLTSMMLGSRSLCSISFWWPVDITLCASALSA